MSVRHTRGPSSRDASFPHSRRGDRWVKDWGHRRFGPSLSPTQTRCSRGRTKAHGVVNREVRRLDIAPAPSRPRCPSRTATTKKAPIDGAESLDDVSFSWQRAPRPPRENPVVNQRPRRPMARPMPFDDTKSPHLRRQRDSQPSRGCSVVSAPASPFEGPFSEWERRQKWARLTARESSRRCSPTNKNYRDRRDNPVTPRIRGVAQLAHRSTDESARNLSSRK